MRNIYGLQKIMPEMYSRIVELQWSSRIVNLQRYSHIVELQWNSRIVDLSLAPVE